MTASPLAGPLDLEREWPLSHAQRRIWWMEQREPGTCLGNVAGVLHAHGPVEVPRLAEAVRLFIAHTPTLRLRFFAREGTLLQRFSATSERSVEVLDFSGSDSPRDARARWCEAAATTPFPLLGQPLYRFAVLREGPEDVLLFANVHHLIGDAVSLGLFAREVSRLYARLGGASPAAGAPCAIYPDLILEERRYLDSEVAARDGAAWRERFASFDSPSTLGRPACLRPSTKATRHSRHLEPAGTRAVQAFARREGVTLARLFTVLGAVFVGRVSGKQDVCLGTYTHNRFSREQLGMFGMFVGTLPLRFQLEPSETLSSAMGRGSLLIQKALKTARYPYDRLLEDLKHPGALFDVVVSHQTVAYGKTLDGAPVRIHWLFNGHEAHALAIHISDRVDEGLLTLDFDFRDDGFAPGVPEQLVESFLHLLRSVVESPGTRTLAELSLVAPRQWEALHALNPAAVAFPSQLQVQQLFEQAARAWPHAVAVRSGEEVLTYEALEAKASVLAARLQSRGVGPGTCVGLWTGRTPDLLVSLLGILKSGACYLPIDPSYPSARIEFLMKDANVRALVVDAGTVVPEGAFGVELVRLGEASDAPRPLPAREGASTDLAYILYTSGSSGQPKGVMLEHRSVVNFLTGMMHALPLEGVRRVLCATTVSFDIFVLETLLPLALGREVLLASEEAQRDPGALAALISRERPGLVQLTPSRLQLLLEHPHGLEALRSVSLLLVGGESLPPLVLEKLGALTATRVFNMYGPTETTVWSTCSELTGQGLVHVGRPIQNTQVFIVDARGELLPRGVIGEVCIGGEGVARGYLNRPELQAERFWTPTFTSGRFYRTGDLGHWLPTGELVLLGRVDAQLKIRGHRIEPGEVEAQILRTGEVSAVAVLGRADRTGVLSLVAFYVPRSGAAAPREALRAVLPPYMVPARWVALEALPALPSGKIDRKALSRIELPDLREHESVAPANDVEARLLGLWRDVLGVSGFGVTDDFFDLGGHSLGAIALVNRIDAELGHRLAVSDVFAHPTIRGLAARLAGAGRDGLALPTPVVLATQDVYAVTPLQKTMYAVHVRAGADNTGHHMTGALRVNGALEPTRLQEAFERLIQRHEALRTSFESHAGEVVQRVHAEVPFALEQLPATGCSLDDLVTGFVRPFDPGRAPLLRAGLCRASAEEATLVVDLHHLIADGASTGILLEELAVLLSGESLSEASLQPKEFAAWRARVRDSAVGEAAVAYWKDRFAEPPSPLELPTDRPRPSAPSFDADTWTMALPEPLTRRLLARCQEARVTPFVFLLAAYELLLARHAASPEVVVVTPVLGRAHPAFARSVGLFVSTVALRSAPQEEVSVRELLTTLATRTREALDHPELPLEQLLAAGAARGGRGLGDVLFTLAEEEEAPVGVAGGVTLRRLAPSIRTAQYDLELTAALTASPSLTLRWTYKTSLFERARVEAMAERYARLLEGLLEDLSRPLQAVSMLTPGDVLALSASQGPVVEHPPRTLARLFEEQADRTPDAPALEFEGERLTYRQLDAWTNQLAHRLVALGVGPNVRVGVCLERSFELVVSLLAVTKAGGAYVPLDPSYPEKRLAFMLEDARPPVLLIQERLRSRFADFTGALLTVGASAAGSSERLPSRADVDDLAYVIYTSGSTGQPKGAMNAHRGISNRLQWMQARYGLTPDDAVLQKTPFSFDVSVWEFFWTLMTGARLVIARPEGHQDPTYLAELIAARGVTTLHFVPSMLEAFVGEGAPARCPSLRRVLCSGEALSFSLQQRFFAQAPAHVQLHNLYGPTEAAVDVSAWECERQPTRPLVPIGRPIDNVRLHNLDPYMNPVPADVRGELYIGGVAVGLGYLGRPELTAQRFVRDPFSSSPEARLYRTGDRCRVLADGAVDYLGRIDGQIKLRGFRIELGEIEAVLTQHPSLAEGAVLLREDAPGHPRLVGYVRPQEPSGFSLEPLQAHLRANLPAHMVPSAWVVLRALPVTPNGKLDRAALPPPEASHEAHVPPRGATEERLAALWMELLGVSRVGRDDDFFALGGHSLLATRLASRIRATFLVDLSLRALFDLGTLKAQAERIDGGAEAVQEAPITRAPDALRHQLSFAQQRLWFLSQLEPGSPLYNIAGVARLRGNLEVATLSRVLELQVARHEVFRTSFAAVDGVPRATVAEHVPFTLTCLDMSGRSSAEVDAWVSEECRRPFDLAQAPLFRATLLRRSEQEHLLVLVMHHIISDGWSLGGLLRELGALYAAPASSGAPPALQYLDYAVWEREQLSGPRFERELEHWKQRLGLHPAVLELPTDRTRPTVQTFRGALLQTRLSGELTRALTTLSHEAGGTLFMTLLAGFKTLLFRYTRQSELIVGTPIANRTRPELFPLIGYVAHSAAFRTRFVGDPTFRDLLSQVRDEVADAQSRPDVPFEHLVEALVPG
ncbi:MAG: amino acid adenylation domain-containing protein, partial [Cystobacter sp.]